MCINFNNTDELYSGITNGCVLTYIELYMHSMCKLQWYVPFTWFIFFSMRGVTSHWHSPKVWFQNYGLGETDSKGPHGWHFYTMGTLLEKAQHENVSEVDSHFVSSEAKGSIHTLKPVTS